MTDRERSRSVSASPRTGATDDGDRPAPASAPNARPRPRPRHGTRLAPDDRGQTVQDFAIGASVFLLTIAFVFAFIPTLFTPFEDNIAPGLESQASRTAAAIVDNGSIDGRQNWMTESSAQSAIDTGGSGADLQNTYDLPETSQVNVTVTPMSPDDATVVSDSGVDYASGDTFRDRPAATVSRIVVIQGVPECDPTTNPDAGMACRLTVRIW